MTFGVSALKLIYGYGDLAKRHRDVIVEHIGPPIAIYDRFSAYSNDRFVDGIKVLNDDEFKALPRGTAIHICISNFVPVVKHLETNGFSNLVVAKFERGESFFSGFRGLTHRFDELDQIPFVFRSPDPSEYIYITGASRGIGRVVAGELASKGFNLIVASKNPLGLDLLQRDLRACKSNVVTHAVDFSCPDSLNAHIRWLLDRKFRITGGFINAGISIPAGVDSVDDCSASAISRMMICNLVAPICLVRALLKTIPIDRAYERVPIVMTGSTISGSGHEFAYAASKGGLEKLVYDLRQIATTSNPALDFCLLDPGWVRTDMGSDFAPSDVGSVLPGAVLPFIVDSYTKTGWISAQRLSGMDMVGAAEVARVYEEI